jgi:cytochrome c1
MTRNHLEFDRFCLLEFPVLGPSYRFKGGGGGGSPPSSAVADTATAKQARQTLYPILESGMAGTGLTTPELMANRKAAANTGLTAAFDTTRADTTSALSRVLKPGDSGVESYILRGLDKEKTNAQNSVRQGFKAETLADKDTAMGLTAATVGNEMRMGISGMQAYNQSVQTNAQNEQQFGTFGTNLMGGLGSGLTNMYFAQKWNNSGTGKG